MRILIAEDDPVSRRMLEATLEGWQYEVTVAQDGASAWEMLKSPHSPRIALLDWMMPGLDGLEVLRNLRQLDHGRLTYVIILTARSDKQDVVTGLHNGANDYIIKPFHRDELRARIHVGVQMVKLQEELAAKVEELQKALTEVKQLQGIIPICCYCKKVRSDDKFWERVEDYIEQRSGAGFSHGICPECWDTTVRPQMEEMWGESCPYEECS